MKLLVRMPTRGRPRQALEVLGLYRDMALRDPYSAWADVDVEIEVVIDADDASMLDPMVLQRLRALDCVITVGEHCTKVEAVNGGRVSGWDVLLLASDDMVPVKEGYAERVLDAMAERWPYLDGALYFDDGGHGRDLCTLPVIGRRLYQRIPYVYDGRFESLFCDLYQHATLTKLNRLEYVDERIIEHRHPVWKKADTDALYRRNDEASERDHATFARLMRGVADWSPKFSVLIPTISSRARVLDRLLDYLYDELQYDAQDVEVCVDGGPESTGVKRQRLLERAVGEYVAFVDDDDWVPHDYVERVLYATSQNPGVDCLSLEGVMTTDGCRPQRFSHSLANGREWVTRGGVHYRPPNHLNPVRRDIALRVGFKDVSLIEDREYAVRLLPHLKTEGSTGPDPLYYYWYDSTTSAAAARLSDAAAVAAEKAKVGA